MAFLVRYVSWCCHQQSGIDNTGILPNVSREIWFSSQIYLKSKQFLCCRFFRSLQNKSICGPGWGTSCHQ
ncbi:hypothetical protein CHARACLAT_011395 [Characodon lateralis]|uniref:Uncharacterized protein n=1 Tax=Characodon lateralis TaxID=208331 RepID=A0ABU7EJL5_9TELE|nr:hypothetical protein [Characodon lateralis]